MPFVLIKGTFHIEGYSPDGDSVRFMADNKEHWAKLSGRPAVLNAKDHAQLRFEAIDTLETHYLNMQQPLELATGALERLLEGLNITDVEWNETRTTVTAANDGTRGYILSREVEEYGRPVAFVYAGTPPEEDGSEIFLDADRMSQSLNQRALEEGFAYPTYYKGLFHDLREALTETVGRAREAQLGVWAEDRTNVGFEVEGLDSITDEHVILPKLFRRLAEYLEAGGSVVGFIEFLEAKEEEIIVISTIHPTHFDTVVVVAGNDVMLTEPPENLIFEGSAMKGSPVPGVTRDPRKRNVADALQDFFSKYKVLKVALTVVLVIFAFTRFYYYEALSTRMDVVFLSLALSVFLVWMIPWEQLWERLHGFSVGGVGISLQQPDVQAAIDYINFNEEQLEISGPSYKAVKDRLRRQLKSLEGELRTVQESRVLWIDDEPHSILGERRLLRALGIDITPAISSERAKEILEEDHDFDLIITDTLRGDRHRATREGVDSDSEGVDSDSEGVDSQQRGTREGVDFIIKLRKGEVTDARIKDLPVIFYVADPWETVENVTSRARNLKPRAEISNSVDDLIPKVIRMLSEQRQNPIPVSAKKISSPKGV